MGRTRKPTEWERRMAENLKALRERAGMTQTELADRAGVSVGTLRCWEQARRTMLFEAAVKVADALGVTLDRLAGRTPPKGK
jgi:transcriptional regulator with XRE-family HTH domain